MARPTAVHNKAEDKSIRLRDLKICWEEQASQCCDPALQGKCHKTLFLACCNYLAPHKLNIRPKEWLFLKPQA